MKRISGFVVTAPLILGSGAVLSAPDEAKIQDRIGVVTIQSEDVASPLAALPLEHFHVTSERPLFAPGRRPPTPPPVVDIPPPPPPPPPNVVLLGIVMDGGVASAVIQVAPENDIHRVRVGDDVRGWKVSYIAARQLILSLEDRAATFTMFQGPR